MGGVGRALEGRLEGVGRVWGVGRALEGRWEGDGRALASGEGWAWPGNSKYA